MVRLPVEYQEVEYLESSGTQYFLTDVDIQDGLTVDSVQTIAKGNDSYLFGGQGDSTTNSKSCFNGSYSNRNSIQGAYPNSYYLIGTVKTDNQTKYHIVSIHANNKRICVVNDVEILNTTVTAFVATTGKCLCFGFNKYGTPSNLYKGKVYSIKVSKADVILADFIPCYRKSDNEPGMYDTVSGVFFTNAGTGTFLVGNDVSWDTAILIERRRQILLNTPHLTTESANPLTFQTDISANLKDCKIYFEPVQEGTGDPSPDNVRPITGWDGVTVTRCGKNLFDSSVLTEQAAWKIVTVISTSGTYTMSTNKPVANDSNLYLFFRKVGSSTLGNNDAVTVNHSATVTLAEGESAEVAFRRSEGTAVFSDYWYQIEQGSAATPYEPYTGTSLTIPFPQTVYGGYVDLVNGEVVETDYLLAVDEDTSIYRLRKNAGKRVVADYRLPYAGKKGKFLYYSHGTVVDAYSSTYNYQLAGTVANDPYNSNTVYAMVAPPSDITETDQYPDWIADVAPLQIVYELATPIVHQLADGPQIIKILKGINNIWSNANGNIEVKFWKH